MLDKWLKERGSDPPVFCPFEEPSTVVLGMNLITITPPGEVIGEFWYDGSDIHIEFYRGRDDVG